jgi:hypothetical protein
MLRWLTWGSWELRRGIDINQDGAVDGSGFLFRLEPPRWLRAWARRRLPPAPKDPWRVDISDVLLQSLLVHPILGTPAFRDDKAGKLLTSWEDPLL